MPNHSRCYYKTGLLPKSSSYIDFACRSASLALLQISITAKEIVTVMITVYAGNKFGHLGKYWLQLSERILVQYLFLCAATICS